MTTTTQASRVIIHDKFEGKGFTDENSLSNALLTKPDELTPIITYLAGKEEDKFPLTFLTEGQTGGLSYKELNDIQYYWKVMKKLKKSDTIAVTDYAATDKPGVSFTDFFITFETDWMKVQHTIVSPNGTRARIMAEPIRVGTHFKYRCRLWSTVAADYVAFTELQAGVKWAMQGGANVSENLSMGNSSNTMTPGAIKNQMGVIRKSYHVVGNMANKTVEVKFPVNGVMTSLWMDFEKWQHQINWRQDCEENGWYSTYNRLADGTIKMIDLESGLAIPSGAGIVDQIPNTDTYSVLTLNKLKQTVLDVTYGATNSPKEIVLYTGIGGAQEFDEAISAGVASLGIQIIGDKFVTKSSTGLSYGAYYNQYTTPQGVTITVKLLNLLDYGSAAEIAPKHPGTGLPITSYEMYFVDQSTYDGERNIQAVTQKGRNYIEGIEKGMAALKEMKIAPSNLVSTEQDKSSVHMMTVKGFAIKNNTHCFKLSCNIS